MKTRWWMVSIMIIMVIMLPFGLVRLAMARMVAVCNIPLTDSIISPVGLQGVVQCTRQCAMITQSSSQQQSQCSPRQWIDEVKWSKGREGREETI